LSLKFTPPVKMDRFALAVGDHFKTYSSIGIAKLAYHAHKWNNDTAYILEKIDGDWYVRYKVEGRTSYAELPWIREIDNSYVYGYSSKYTRWTQKRTSPEEYAAWRLRVEYERLSELPVHQLVDTLAEYNAEQGVR